jgi:hypothetical protein
MTDPETTATPLALDAVPGDTPAAGGVPDDTPAPHGTPAPATPGSPPRPRPIIERIGMAFIAVILAALFAVVAVAAFAGGEPFLGVMGAIGCLMVLWVGGLTLFKGR